MIYRLTGSKRTRRRGHFSGTQKAAFKGGLSYVADPDIRSRHRRSFPLNRGLGAVLERLVDEAEHLQCTAERLLFLGFDLLYGPLPGGIAAELDMDDEGRFVFFAHVSTPFSLFDG